MEYDPREKRVALGHDHSSRHFKEITTLGEFRQATEGFTDEMPLHGTDPEYGESDKPGLLVEYVIHPENGARLVVG